MWLAVSQRNERIDSGGAPCGHGAGDKCHSGQHPRDEREDSRIGGARPEQLALERPPERERPGRSKTPFRS